MRRLGLIAAGLALGWLAALALLGAGARLALLQSWVFAAQFWTGLSAGAAVLLIIHAVTGGRWGEAVDPWLRLAAAALPVAVLAWVPLLLSAGGLFPWAVVAPDSLPETVIRKLPYLDVGFLRGRTVIALAVLLGVGWAAGAWSGRRPGLSRATAALFAYAFAISILAIDWLLAFEPVFYSTAYPVIHAAGGVVAAMAFGTLLLWRAGAEADRLADCAMLMLGWAMIWLYLVFMQYLIVWSGDLPQEIGWYLRRLHGGWAIPLWLGIACHAGAVAAMASPALKQRPGAVAAAAGALVLGQAMELWWRSAPAFAPAISARALLDWAALLALGALWLAAGGALRGRAGHAR